MPGSWSPTCFAGTCSTWARERNRGARIRTEILSPTWSWLGEMTSGTFPCQSTKTVPVAVAERLVERLAEHRPESAQVAVRDVERDVPACGRGVELADEQPERLGRIALVRAAVGDTPGRSGLDVGERRGARSLDLDGDLVALDEVRLGHDRRDSVSPAQVLRVASTANC